MYREFFYNTDGTVGRNRYPFTAEETAIMPVTAQAQAEMWENTFAACPSVEAMIAAIEAATGGTFAYDVIPSFWAILWDGQTRMGHGDYARTRERGVYSAWMRYVQNPSPDYSAVLIADRFAVVAE